MVFNLSDLCASALNRFFDFRDRPTAARALRKMCPSKLRRHLSAGVQRGLIMCAASALSRRVTAKCFD